MARAAPAGPPPQHDRILNAALTVFGRHGFDRTTMADIAAEAGMSVGNLYRYFANKEALILAFAEAERERTAAFIARAADGADMIALFGEALAEMLAEATPARVAVDLEIIAEAARPGPLKDRIVEGEAETHAALAAVIAAARAEGRLPPSGAEPALAATMLMALYEGLCSRRCFQPDFEIEPAVRAAQAMARTILLGQVRPVR